LSLGFLGRNDLEPPCRYLEAPLLRNEEGRRNDRLSIWTQAAGFIIYTDEGYMSVVITSSGRDLFEANDLLGASAAEKKAQAAETYLSYCGRYEYRGNSVVHHVELSLFRTGAATTRSAA
jgi:hypothetical protein